jgi:hypothetical protein
MHTKLLDALQRRARDLLNALEDRSKLDPIRSFIDQAAVLQHTEISADDRPYKVDDLKSRLLAFEINCSKAKGFIAKGRPPNPRHLLTLHLALILRDAQQTVDAKPQGTLCRLVAIVLEDLGEKPSDIRKVVEPVVRDLEKSSPKKS